MTYITTIKADNVQILSEIGETVTIYTPTVTTDNTDNFPTATSLGSGTSATAYLKDVTEEEMTKAGGKYLEGETIGYFASTSSISKDNLVQSAGSKLYKIVRILSHYDQASVGYYKLQLMYLRDVS